MFIYHIVKPDEWDRWAERSYYEAPSLASEGFIHCSFEEQLEGVVSRYYPNEPELIVLKIDATKLISKLIAEPSTGDELYPHVYGPINTDAIIRAEHRPNLTAKPADPDA